LHFRAYLNYTLKKINTFNFSHRIGGTDTMRKAYFFLFLLIAWSFLFWWHYVYNIKQLHTSTVEPDAIIVPEPAPTVISPTTNTLLFKPKTYGLILNGGNEAVINSILAEGNPDQLLRITGLNGPEEQEDLDFDLGLARAAELKKLLIDSLSEDRIEIFTDITSNFNLTTDSLFEGVRYEWVDDNSNDDDYVTEEPTNYFLIDHDTKRVKTEDFQSIIDAVAQRLIDTRGKVIINGHTDSSGEKELNFTIALRNAKDIRDELKAKGVDKKQIETTSRGEEAPTADNKTEQGRKDNRRIELQIEE